MKQTSKKRHASDLSSGPQRRHASKLRRREQPKKRHASVLRSGLQRRHASKLRRNQKL